ncbi:MAG: hypothetical protein COV66_10980 [Nitrospinae bacterium CG11_big_fil_rev_8_21_14_0_20_45_15]|nr:MAG: hypothetical protein COV66_10980 [Nitrospinae bacterium CG11_big_fil_rev_8_21_14_0_20_45_15]
MSILAENLKTIRKERDCTQSEFAKILGIGFRTYVRYEVGERDAPITTLVKIALLGNLSLEKLLTEKITLLDFYPLANVGPSEDIQIDFADFQTNILHLKNYSMPIAIAFEPSEKQFLALFRRLSPRLQEIFSKNLGEKDWKVSAFKQNASILKEDKTSKIKNSANNLPLPSGSPGTKKRGRKKLDPNVLQRKIEKLKMIAQSANKTTVR